LDFLSQVGSQEILLILLVAIIVIGPAKIVEFGKTMGKVTRNIKRTTSEISTSISRELAAEQKEKPKDAPPQDKKS